MEALANNSALQYLYVDGNGVGLAGVNAIASYLRKPEASLLGLSMGCNRVGDEGATLLAEALYQNTTLRRFCLGSCGIGSSGAESLAQMLVHNNTLQHLDLGYLKMTAPLHEIPNRIETKGCLAIAVSLETNRSLLSLDISMNAIGQAGMEAIERVLLLSRPPHLYEQQLEPVTTHPGPGQAFPYPSGLLQIRFLQYGINLSALTMDSIRLQMRERMVHLHNLHGISTLDIESLTPVHLAEIASVYRLGKEYKWT
jgi:Ran GTPase-activating protein (RanGAP) involved in mRNA processing and transport